jgi:peroxiredoxin
MKTLLLALSSVVATTLFAADSPPVGATAPDFSLADASGKAHSLSEYKGKYVVLEWFNPECPFVKKHYGSGNMQKLQGEYTGKGVVWLTIDSNAPGYEGNMSPEQAQKVMKDLNTKQTALLLDPEGKAGRAYNARNTRTCSSSIPWAKSFMKARSTAKLRRIQPTSRVRPTG